MSGGAFQIETLTPAGFDDRLAGLSALLNACVHDGASISFILPHSLDDSLAFWRDKVRPALLAGGRTVLAATMAGRVAGSVQLDCDTPPNQPHRAEVAKLLVHPDFRRRGIARALMVAIEAQAQRMGRNLITLDTASAGAERLYKSLGYRRAGVIPGYARDPLEDRYDATTIMFKAL